MTPDKEGKMLKLIDKIKLSRRRLIYGLEVEDNSFETRFSRGNVLWVKKDTRDDLVEGEWVVFRRKDGQYCAGEVHFQDDQVRLDPFKKGEDPIYLTQKERSRLDRVMTVDYVGGGPFIPWREISDDPPH
jgi:hypothetical protein